jgi:RNA recognition motif-containing protein
MAGGPMTGGSSSSSNSLNQIPFATSRSSPPLLSPLALARPTPNDKLSPVGASNSFNLASISERNHFDKMPSILNHSNSDSLALTLDTAVYQDHSPSIIIRNLPASTNMTTLQTMLIFSQDLLDAQFIETDSSDDRKYVTAVARFGSTDGANHAKNMLDGKSYLNGNKKLSVELFNVAPGRRNIGPTSTSSSLSSNNDSASRQSSRFNGQFQSMENRISPNLGSDALPSRNQSFGSFYNNQAPIANASSSRDLINDDPSDDTTQLLNETVTYRNAVPQLPISRMAGLSLSTAGNQTSSVASPMTSMASPQSLLSSSQATTPNPMSPSLGMNGGYSNGAFSPHHAHAPFPRTNFNNPPANPADQHPPCNTLYVGNLPMDAVEDELKQLFSKQKGYKRLCFRIKPQGPMCFVEFEDTSFATRALKELYGIALHNSVKGGIRLSFSKNPLGVRSVQNVSNHIAHSLGSPTLASHGQQQQQHSSHTPHGFTTASGPPPGLLPPGYPSAQAGLGINGPPGLARDSISRNPRDRGFNGNGNNSGFLPNGNGAFATGNFLSNGNTRSPPNGAHRASPNSHNGFPSFGRNGFGNSSFRPPGPPGLPTGPSGSSFMAH